jgi:rRNA maturation endonuclease Nob1
MDVDSAQAAQGVPVEPETLKDWRRYCDACKRVVDSDPQTLLAGTAIFTLPTCPSCGQVLAVVEAKQGA